MRAALLAGGLLGGSGLVALIACWHVIDRGPCLASHPVAHHLDAGVACLPTVEVDGSIGLSCHLTDAEDWTETVCDVWTYPHGKAERE